MYIFTIFYGKLKKVYAIIIFNLKGDKMKTKIVKLGLVSGIAFMAGDPAIVGMVALTYISAEVVSYLVVKTIRNSYTKKVIESGVLYRK